MESLLQPPVATAFDAASSLISAVLYLVVAAAALARAPADSRTRVFLVIAIASAAPYSITTLIYLRGARAAFYWPVVAATTLSLMFGSLALFHFTQVFPWRRPWIRAHGRWLAAAYAGVVLLGAVGIWMLRTIDVAVDDTSGLGAPIGIEESLALIVVVLPAVFALGVVTPFAGLLSLYKSWIAARTRGIRAARVTTFWMLISQMAGGVLTILIIPLLHLVAPAGPWVTIAAVLLFGFSLLMPIAFAVGVWKLRVLDLDIDSLVV
jgi:hypothetical protein